MARTRSGGFFNKALEFIGLVDEEPQDYPEEEERYSPPSRRSAPSGGRRDTGRESAYAQPRSSRSSRSADPRRQETRSYTRVRDRYDEEDEPRPSRSRSRSGQDDLFNARSAQEPRAQSSYSSRSPYSYENVRRAQETRRPAPPPRREPPQRRQAAPARSKTVMYSMRDFSDCREVIRHLIAGNTIVLTLEDLGGELSQRVLDTLSGAVFALGASIRRASGSTYLLAPSSVDVNDAFDMDDEEEL